jgi:hypothetical protein
MLSAAVVPIKLRVVIPITLHVTAPENQEHWHTYSLEKDISTHCFCILDFDGVNSYPLAILNVTDQAAFLEVAESPLTHTDQSKIYQDEINRLQKYLKNRLFLKNSINSFNRISSNSIEEPKIKKNHSQSEIRSSETEAPIENPKQIRIVTSPDVKKLMSCQEKIQAHRNTLIAYYTLLTKPNLANSESDLDKIAAILKQAEEDDILSLLLNEVDNLIVQTSSGVEPGVQQADYQKWAEVFKTHVDSCTQLDSEVSRLMTTISSLIEELQHVAEKTEVIEEKLEEKVESLELLMQEAKVEKHRRKLRICFNKPQTAR